MIKLFPNFFNPNPGEFFGIRDADTSPIHTLSTHGLNGFKSQFFSPHNPLPWESPAILNRWIPTLFNSAVIHSPSEMAALSPSPTPQAPSSLGWLEALPEVGDAVLRADIDFYNLPFSRNVVGNPLVSSGLLRSSEYNPKEKEVPGVYVEIPRQVFGRAHGEIRPIRGQDESLITRVTLDYQGAEVKFLLKNSDKKILRKAHLELDCFTAVTSPTMEYDFSLGSKSVIGIGRDGDNRYENACRNRKPREDIRTTDFYSEAPAPPKTQSGTNPDWMFYFQPIETTLGQSLMRRYTNKHIGALWLWANNPTFGFVDPKHYEKLGIRYNTWPRRFGDLIRFFSPLFDAPTRTRLHQEAPFLNPNSEYLDEEGKRQKIPDDPQEIARLNQQRAQLNEERKHRGLKPLPAIPRPRGPAVDWVFTDLMKDPQRMALTPPDRWPKATLRLQFKPGTVLNLPIGKVAIHPDTEIQASFALTPVEETHQGKKVVRAQALLTFSVGPLNLGKTDLNFGDFHIQAGKNLAADRLEFQIPFDQVYTDSARTQWKLNPQIKGTQLTVAGLRGRDLVVQDQARGVDYQVKEISLEKVTWENSEELGTVVLEGLKAKDLEVKHEVGSIAIAAAGIPKIKLQARHDLQAMSVQVGQIASSGSLTLKPNFGNQTEIQMRGSSEISDLHFQRSVEAGQVETDLRFKLSGAVPEATVRNPLLGEAGFSMQEGETLHQLEGNFRARLVQPKGPKGEKGKLDYEMSFEIPYTTFHLQSPLVDMPKGKSTLRDGTIRISRDQISFEGDLRLKAREIRAPGTDLLRWYNFTVNPHLEDVTVTGSALFEYTQSGFRLQQREGGPHPIQAGFRLTDSRVTHTPTFTPAELKAHPELGVVRTDVKIDEAQVLIEDLQELDYQTLWVDGKKRGRSASLQSGPIFIHHIRGGGDIWVNTFLWSWLKGSFPHFGVPLSALPPAEQKPRPKHHPQPDPEKLIGHLDAKKKKLLWDEDLKDYSNFIYLGGISIGEDPAHPGDPERSFSQFRDLVIYTHETGNYWQFGAVGIPEISFLQRLNRKGKPDFEVFTGSGAIYNHIYLKEPKRGHNPFILRTPGEYQAPD